MAKRIRGIRPVPVARPRVLLYDVHHQVNTHERAITLGQNGIGVQKLTMTLPKGTWVVDVAVDARSTNTQKPTNMDLRLEMYYGEYGNRSDWSFAAIPVANAMVGHSPTVRSHVRCVGTLPEEAAVELSCTAGVSGISIMRVHWFARRAERVHYHEAL